MKGDCDRLVSFGGFGRPFRSFVTEFGGNVEILVKVNGRVGVVVDDIALMLTLLGGEGVEKVCRLGPSGVNTFEVVPFGRMDDKGLNNITSVL